MSNSKRSGPETVPLAAGASKRVILSMGGKGGVGKTSVMAGLAEWFDTNQILVKLLDLDTENKARGSLTHFFAANDLSVDFRQEYRWSLYALSSLALLIGFILGMLVHWSL